MPTADTVRELMAETTGQAFIQLITIRADGFDTGYMAANTEDFVSRGRTYTGVEFEFTPPKRSGQELSKAKIRISNVSLELIELIRTVQGIPTLEEEIVAASRPDVVEVSSGELLLEDITYDVASINANLGYEKIFDELYPFARYTPNTFPAVF